MSATYPAAVIETRILPAGTSTAAIQAQLDAGEGTVTLEEGTHTLSTTLTIPAGVHLRGRGMQATFVRLGNGVDDDCIQTEDFSTLTGTNASNSDIFGWSISDMTIDGNKENNASGRGIAVYGIGTIRDVEVRDCSDQGIWSEWGSSAGWRAGFADGVGYGPESTLDNVRVIFCDGGGIEWRGPTDSRWTNVVTGFCGPVDGSGEATTSGSTTSGMNITTRGQGLQAIACHSYGVNQKYAIRSSVATYWEGCVAEGAQNTQVVFADDSCQWSGGQVFGVPPDHDDVYGFQVGEAGTAAAGTIIDGARITNCINGAINFVNDSGNGRYEATIFQASGTDVVGTQGGNFLFPNYFDLHVSGGAARGAYLAGSGRPLIRKKLLPLNILYGEAQTLISATFDAGMAPAAAQAPNSGFLFVQRHMVPFTTTFTNLHLYVNAGGSGLTSSQNLVGLYSSSGTLIAKSADQSSSWTSSGLKTIALTAESGQSLTIPGDENAWIYSAFLTVGSSPPQFWLANSTKGDLTNAGLIDTEGFRAGKSGASSLTSLASSMVAVGADAWLFWVGLS